MKSVPVPLLAPQPGPAYCPRTSKNTGPNRRTLGHCVRRRNLRIETIARKESSQGVRVHHEKRFYIYIYIYTLLRRNGLSYPFTPLITIRVCGQCVHVVGNSAKTVRVMLVVCRDETCSTPYVFRNIVVLNVLPIALSYRKHE